MAEVSGGWVRRRQRLGWMDGLKVALGNRGTTVEAAGPCAKDRKEWRAHSFQCVLKNTRKEWRAQCVLKNTLCSFGPPSHALVVITWRGEGCRYMMGLG